MSINDDITEPTTPAADDLPARLAAFRQNPKNLSLYDELRDILQAEERHGDLAELDELRAAHESNERRAAALWNQAGNARLAQGQGAAAARNFENALDIDPADANAAGQLARILIAAERYADAADVMEDELAELKEQAAHLTKRKQVELVPHRVERHRILAALWNEKLGRVDRALHHWQQAWHLDPQRTDALEAAREIYASLGDENMVARLYEAELKQLGDRGPKPRRAEIELALGRIFARRGDAPEAAKHLEVALRLNPDSDAARETLAEVYTSPQLADEADRQRRAAELLVVLGRHRLDEADHEQGIAFLRRALGVDPASKDAFASLGQALSEAERWEELDRLYQHRQTVVENPRERADLMRKRAHLYETAVHDRQALKEMLVELAAMEPPHSDVSRQLRTLYREDENWAELARLIEAELPALRQDPHQTCAEMLELATIVREHLGDRDRAAEILHEILLNIDANNQEALARYGDHFRERRDWRGLADLLEFAVDNAREAGADPEEQIRQLEEIARVAEQRLGDIERAINTWTRIQTLEPRSRKPEEAIRRLQSRGKMWSSLVGVLEREAQAAESPTQRANALRRIAQVYRERQVNPQRAIALYEEVAGIFPDDAGVLKALSELYEREGDDSGLAHTLRRRLDLDARKMAASGQAGSSREWPVAKRVERLTSLRRLASMYENLNEVDGVVFACSGILDILPGDRDALDRLERALDKAGDVERLKQTLQYHASAASGPAERAKVLRWLARIATEAKDQQQAMQGWEEVLKTAPNDTEALQALADLYEQHERWPEMAKVLERGLSSQRNRPSATNQHQRAATQAGRAPTHVGRAATHVGRAATHIGRAATQHEHNRGGATAVGRQRPLTQGLDRHAPGPASGGPASGPAGAGDGRTATTLTPTERLTRLTRFARVVDDKLGDVPRATRAWQEILALAPKDREALQALARLYQAAGQWRDLAAVLATQVPLLVEDDAQAAAEVALERARLLEKRLGTPTEAETVLEELLRDIDPANVDAHQALRRLYESHGNFESAVRIAEREMYLAQSADDKITRGLEIGLMCRDRLQDPTRALQAFERVLHLKADHEEALAAAADLYLRVEDWPNHVRALERQVEVLPSGPERRDLMMRIAQVTAERLDDPKGAFQHYRQAHESAPDATTMAALRRAAEAYELWEELAEVCENERARLCDDAGTPTDNAAYVAACRELVAIAERRLNAPARAMNVLLDAVLTCPDDAELLAEAERIATASNDRAQWQLLLECLGAGLDSAPRRRRVLLHCRRAEILEVHLGDAETAVEELLKAFAWNPEQPQTREALYEIAERTGSWTDVVAVETALLERAGSNSSRIELLRRKAAVIEDKLKDPVRAFRTHLVALLLDPEDSDTAAQMWRLGRLIGAPYRAADKTPRPEPPAAYVHPREVTPGRTTRPQSVAAPATRSMPALPAQPAQSDIVIRSQTAAREPTEELTIGDLRELLSHERQPGTAPSQRAHIDSANPPREPTQELTMGDLLDLRASLAAKPDNLDDNSAEIEFSGSDNDTTIQLEIDEVDIEESAPGQRGAKPERPDPTIELRTEDLIVALGKRGSSGDPRVPAPPPLPGVTRRPAPPAPPPPPPPAPPPPPQPNRRPLPAMPMRAYESPWDEFASVYDLLPAATPQAKMHWLFKAAQVWEAGADDIGRAFNTLARALELGVDNNEPRARLQRLAAAHDAWDRLADLYEAAAEEAGTIEAAVGLLMEVAEVRVQQQRPREAEALYRRVLGMRPDDPVARERIEGLYRAEGRWVDLAASLEERTDPRLGVAAPENERPALLRELAEIYQVQLQRTHDAIDALHRLQSLMPEDVGVLRELGELYGQVGRWSKVIEMLNRVGEIAEGSGDAREALRRIAEIYERELELPDRAIDAYTQLVSLWPDDTDAYAALDKLLEAHARWNDLADILRRRAALTRDPQARAQLLRRRAAILLRWVGAPEEAAAALRHARTLTPDAPGLADELVHALLAAGREREAASVLEIRIDHRLQALANSDLADAGGGAGDLAALMIRLADLRAERLGDVSGAKQTLERALELVPDHPTALAALARLVENEQDPRAYAEARLREAEALSDLDAKVEALMKAGLTLRDRCSDIDAARSAFEEVLRVRPYHPDATWALAGLVEQSGDPGQAAQVLEARLQAENLEASEIALIKTQLAALARQAGVEAAAERRLIEALETAPNHLPAIIARADLLAEADRYQDLEQFLCETLPRLQETPPEALAELHRRLALAYENLDRSDEAYQTLLNADKLHRGHLLVKLALGENRFRAQRWREAALHLSSLAMHVDARNYPAEVAEGLYHAAQAEIRSLRPDKARPLYERALDLKPNYTPALHALAAIALEHGDHKRAAALLTRQAEATEDPVERMRLFEALGDMAVDTLRDDRKALACYQAAVEAAAPLESTHLPLLEKLLQRQELAGDNRGAARTAELMASFGTDASARAARYTTAAENYLAIGDQERGLSAARRAVESEPYDLTAVTVLSELLMQADDYDEVAAVLGRALSKQDEDDEFTAPRKSLLWNRLAHARRARGDIKGGTTAWERSVALAGNSDGAMNSRRALLEVWKDDPGKRELLLEYRRILALDTLDLKDVVTYARALCQAKHDDGGRAMLELAQVMGHRLTDLDRSFLDRRPVYQMADDEAYRNPLSEPLRDAVILDRVDDPEEQDDLLGDVLRTVWEAAGIIWGEAEAALQVCGVRAATPVSRPSNLAPVNIFPRISAALDAPATVIYTTETADAPDVQLVCAATPIVVLGPNLVAADNAVIDKSALRFLMGRTAEMSRAGNVIAAGMPTNEFFNLLGSLLRSFGPPHLHDAVPGTFLDPDAREAYDEAQRTTLPIKLRDRLKDLLKDATARDIDPERFLHNLDLAADRAGLLMCGDIATAVANAGAVDGQGQRMTRHLIYTPLGEHYLEARTALGVGVR